MDVLGLSKAGRGDRGESDVLKLDKRLLRLLSSNWFSFSLTILFGICGGILAVLLAGAISYVIAQVFLAGQPLSAVMPWLIFALSLMLFRALVNWAGFLSANRLAGQVKLHLRDRLFAHLQELGPAYLATRQRRRLEGDRTGARTGELVNVAMEGVETLDAYFSQYLPQLVLAALVPLTFLAFIFPRDPLSGLVLLLTAPLIPFFMILIGHLADIFTKKQWETLSRISAHFLDVLQGLATLKMFGRSRAQLAEIAWITDRYRRDTMGVLRVAFLSALVLELVATLSTAIVAVGIGLRLLYGHLDFAAALFVLLLVPEFYLPLRNLGARFHAGLAGLTASRRIFEILETPAPEGAKRSPFPQPPSNLTPSNLPSSPFTLRFRDVNYAYPGEPFTLADLSFELLPGQKVALVGRSGVGKSTVAALLLRLLVPSNGQIEVNGTPLKDIPRDEWRRLVSWVPQRPHLFHDTVVANLRLACPQAPMEAVIAAARLARADDFILRMPHGYETVIGERGARLSGGEVQRLALARAFLKDAPILILDEATANLDPALIASIDAATRDLMTGRTTLIIAHRLATIRDADQILVLEAGRLVESGTHTNLLTMDGAYAELVRTGMAGDGEVVSTKYFGAISLDSFSFPNLEPGHTLPPAPDGEPEQRSLSTLRHLMGLLLPFKNLIALATFLGFATVASGIGLMATSAFIISAAALQPSIASLQVAIVGVRFFGLARGLFRYLERYVSHDLTFRLLARLRLHVFQALEPLAPARLSQYRSGDLLSRVIADIACLENLYLRALSPPMVAILVAVLAASFMGFHQANLAIALLGFLCLGGVILPLLILILNRRSGDRLLRLRSTLTEKLVEGIQGMADLQVFGGEGRYLENVAALSRQLNKGQSHQAWINGLQGACLELISYGAAWVILLLAIPLVNEGQIPGVLLAVLFLAALSSFEALVPLPLAAQHLDASLAAGRRLLAIANTPPLVRDPPVPLPLAIPLVRGGEDRRNLRTGEERQLQLPLPTLSARSLYFRYAAGEGQALSDLSFSLPPGKRLAIVGPSGSGKTTLIKLLLRFWDYQDGEIMLDGVDVRHFAQEDVRRLFAVVSQQPHLFNATVRKNLLIANPQASQSQLFTAARLAHIHEFICSLPQGYETWIGEHGLRLSGGERQRLALARALLMDAPFLILDEPTANLDAFTERNVLHNLLDQAGSRSLLLITHRLVAMHAMHEILVLNGGRLVERGDHEELLESNGFYRRMWDFQDG
jgi:ATP-binding cassette, subfamily C, bacterial CydCD